MSKKQIIARDYNFSDADLKNVSDNVLNSVQRDKVQFALRGVTDEKLAQVQTLVNNFANIPTDVESLNAVASATLNKDTIAENLRVKLRSVRTMAQNVHGTQSPLYRSFGFEGMVGMSDNQLFLHGKRVIREATAQLSQLTPEGLTAAMITAIQTLLTNFENAMHTKQQAEKSRDIQTQLRIDAGNALYNAITRLCNTGKDIWASVNEAYYNVYVIYTAPSGAKPANANPGMISGNITSSATSNALPNATGIIEGTQTAVTTDDEGDYVFDNLAPGTYTLLFALDGYTNLRIEGILVNPGEESLANGVMNPVGG